MARIIHIALPLALSVLVILTGQGVASSRGVDRVVGQMVLCTGTGPVVVYVDQDGQPTKAPHYCPDYAIGLLGAILPSDAELSAIPAKSQRNMVLRIESLIALPLPRLPARSPPVSV